MYHHENHTTESKHFFGCTGKSKNNPAIKSEDWLDARDVVSHAKRQSRKTFTIFNRSRYMNSPSPKPSTSYFRITMKTYERRAASTLQTKIKGDYLQFDACLEEELCEGERARVRT